MKELIFFIGIVVLGFWGCLIAFQAVATLECNRLAEDSKHKTEFRLIGGCYIENKGVMIPEGNWREID